MSTGPSRKRFGDVGAGWSNWGNDRHRARAPTRHAGWAYRILRPGAYLWTLTHPPLTYYRDGTGTTDLGRLSAA